MNDRPKRLYRSQSNKVFAGVCGGIAEYFDLDPAVVRILWVLASLLPLVPGILLYVIALFVIPQNPNQEQAAGDAKPSNLTGMQLFGAALIVIGGFWLLDNFDVISMRWWWHNAWKYAFPALLVLAGLALMLKNNSSRGGHVEESNAGGSGSSEGKPKVLRKSTTDKKFLGVCGGLGEYLDIDSNIVRVIFALVAVSTFGVGVFLYLLLYFLMERERHA